MKEDDGRGVFGWGSRQHGVVTVGMEAANDLCSGWFIDAQTLSAEGDAAVGVDASRGALAPDVRPPWAVREGAQNRTFLAAGPLPGGLRGGADLAMLFVRVAMCAQLIEQWIGERECGDLLGGKEGGQTFLPVIMEAFDFAFGLRRGSVAQGDFVEAQGGAKLGKCLWSMGEEEGVVIDIEGQGQAAGGKGAGEEVEMSQERLARVEPRKGHDAAVVVNDFKQVQRLAPLAEPAVRRSIVLPQLADLLDLPAPHRFAWLLVFSVRGEPLPQSPAADAGAINLEVMATMRLRGREAVGGRRARLQQLAQEIADFLRPAWMVIATRAAWLPGSVAALNAGAEVIGVENIKAAAAQIEFGENICRGEEVAPEPRHDITNKWRRMPPAQLLVVFFKPQTIPIQRGASAHFAPPPLRSGSAKCARSCFDRSLS